MPGNFETRLEARQELKGVSEVITREADYNILYNAHYLAPIPAETLKAIKPHALFLEGGADYADYVKSMSLSPEDKNNQPDLSKIKNFIYEKFLEWQKAYSKIMEEAREEKIPIFLVDIARQKSLLAKDVILSNINLLLPAVESAAGIGLMAKSRVEIMEIIKKNEDMTRRDFLKKALKIGGELIGGAYLASSPAYYYVPKSQLKISPENLSPTVSRFINETMSNAKKLHPEIKDSFIVQGRNELIAEKSEAVAKMLGKELSLKPKIALAIGALHYEIEQSLKENETTRMEKLYNFLGDDLRKEKYAVRIDFLEPTKAGDLVFKASLIELPIFETFVNKKSHSASSAE